MTVALMAAPFDVFSEGWKEKHPYDVEHGYTQHGDHEEAVTPEAFRVISKVKHLHNRLTTTIATE